jgi:hypothetical protein
MEKTFWKSTDLTFQFDHSFGLLISGFISVGHQKFNIWKGHCLPNWVFIASGQARLSASELQACLKANDSPMRDEPEPLARSESASSDVFLC